MNSLLMWISGLLIAVLALLFAGPHFIDWNGYRGLFEEEASRLMGREVRVGGDVNLRLLPAPYVRFEELRIADTSGIAGGSFFSAKSFTMWLSVPPLLKGELEANKVELKEPSLRLAADKSGRGNWTSLSFASGSLPFVPASVTLQSVNIVDGQIGFSAEGSGQLANIDKINGEFVAKALAGPFSFRGTADIAGQPHNVRVVTSEAGAGGALRFKAVVRTSQNAVFYQLDASLKDLSEKASVDGDFQARFGLGKDKQGLEAAADIKSRVAIDSTTLKLSEIVTSFENLGQPQLVTGQLSTSWGQRKTLSVDLNSKWLDVDRLFGGAGAGLQGLESGSENPKSDQGAGENLTRIKPFEVARALIGGLIDVLPKGTDLKAGLEVDQVNLGGDAVSDIRLVLERARGPVKLKTLKARLPGGARLDFSGELTKLGSETAFSGNVFLGGPSLTRFFNWMRFSGSGQAAFSDGPFSVAGNLSLAGKSFELRDAHAEFFGEPVRGNVLWRSAETRKLQMRLTGRELDTRWFGFDAITFSELASMFSADQGGEPTTSDTGGLSRKTSWLSALGDEVQLQVRALRLKNGSDTLKDVDADFSVVDGVFNIPRLRFVTPAGLKLDFEGKIKELGKAPRGSIRWIATADTAQALRGFVQALVSPGDDAAGGADVLKALVPMQLAGTLSLGGRKPGVVDVDLDGMVNGGRTTARLRLDGGLQHWRKSQVDLTATINSPDVTNILQLMDGRDGARVVASVQNLKRPAQGLIKAVGTPVEGMQAMSSLQSAGLSLIYDGVLALADDPNRILNAKRGELVVAAADAREALRLFGLSLPAGVAGVPLTGLADLQRQDDVLSMVMRDVKFGASTFGGQLKVTRQSASARTIDADLAMDQASVPGLLSGLLGRRRSAVVDADQTAGTPGDGRGAGDAVLSDVTVDAASDVFSEQPFDLRFLDGVQGQVKLKVGKLFVDPEIAIAQARISTTLTPERIDIDVTEGQGLQGRIGAKFGLEKAAAGVKLAGSLNISNAALKSFQRTGEDGAVKPLATGLASLSAKFSGRALSPRGLIAVLQGDGEIITKDAVVNGLAPAVVGATVDSVLGASPPSQGGGSPAIGEPADVDLAKWLVANIAAGQVKVGSKKIPIEILDGAARVQSFGGSDKAGQTAGVVTVDIAALKVDAEWRIKAKDSSAKDWPDVTVGFVGPLGQVGTLKPQISAGALEREIAVRQLEQNVNELERLRKLDEEAARRQREREKALEAERARRAAAAKAALDAERAAREAGTYVEPAEVPIDPQQLQDWQAENQPSFEPDGALPPPVDAQSVDAEALPPVSEEPESVAPRRKYRPRKRAKRKEESAGEILQRQLQGF